MSASSSKSSLFITLRPWLISAVALLALVLLVQQLAKPSGPERPERGPRGAVSEDFLVSASAVERVDLPVHYNALGTVTAFNTVVVRSRRAPAATKRMDNALSEEERRRLAELLKEEEKQ